MYEADKLNRDDLLDKEQAPEQELDSPIAPGPQRAPDMPELGGGGMGPGARGIGSRVDAAEQADEQKKHDMAELERLKGLPPGHPDLEAAKKPEATDAKVPEGPGLTGAAKSDAASMSPESEQQGDAEVGDSPGAPAMSEAPGAGVAIPAMDLGGTLEGQGEAGAARGVADKAAADYASAQNLPQEAPKEVPSQPGGEVAPGSPEQLSPEPPSAPEAVQAAALAPEASAETIETPTGPREHSIDVSQPEQEVLSDPEPEVIPEVAEEQVAPAAAAADAATEPEVPTADVQTVQEAAPVEVADAVDAEAGRAPADILVQSPAPASILVQSPAPVTELPGADVQVPGETPPEAILVQETAPIASEALAPPGGPSPSPSPGAGAPGSVPGSAPGGPGLGPEQSVQSVSARAPSGEAMPSASAAILVQDSAGAMPGAPSGDEAPAAGPRQQARQDSGAPVPVDAAAGQGAPAEAPAAQVPAAQADAGLGDDIANIQGGKRAAELGGEPVFGASAIGADQRAKAAPGGEDPGHVAAVQELQKNAKPELLSELGDSGATEALEKVKTVGSEVGNTAQKLDSQVGELESHVDSFAKRAKDLESFRANPGDRTKELLGKGEEVEANLRTKAEKSLGESLGQVRIHKGQGAREIAGAIDATAFTHNEDIILGEADALPAADRENVILEELVHAAQMKKGGGGGRSGVSAVTDRAEKAAKAAARAIQEGARTEGVRYDDERRAIYRSESTSSDSSGATFPANVRVSLGGRTVTINLPQTSVEASKLVTLPSMNVPGLNMNAHATLFFDTETGDFKGGATSGSIAVGEVLGSDSRDIRIDRSGNMTATFHDANLRVGDLIDAHIDASVGNQGVTAQGNIGVADLRGDKLSQWLKGGQLSVAVDNLGNVSGSGNLDIEVAPFSRGTLAAHIENQQLAGISTIKQTANVDIGPAAKLGTGSLSGILTESSDYEIEGQLDLTVIPLPSGTGKANITWSGETGKIGGQASFSFESQNRIEPTTFTRATLTGAIEESQLARLDGSGHAVYDNLFEGDWSGGGIDILERKAGYTMQGALKEPIERGVVKVSSGALTIQVADNTLASTSGNVDFELAQFMKGTAVLEAGTDKSHINATATAALVQPKVFDEVKLSEGAAVISVRGTEVKVVSGSVDLDFRNGVAVGKLDLAPTAQWDLLSGHGQANIRAGEVWGELAVKKGHVDIDVHNNRLVTAQGHAKFETKGSFGGNLSFNAKDNFAVLSGTAQAWLTKNEAIGGGVKVLGDSKTQFTGKVQNSALTAFKGPMSWAHPKFEGKVTVEAWTTEPNQITGTGPADVKQPFSIGNTPRGKLTAQPGSKLTGHFSTGVFDGVSGTVIWQYHQWLQGKARIDQPTPGIGPGQLSGELAAGIIAPHLLEGGSHIRLQPSPIGSLTVKLQDGRPSQYRGNVNFSFRDFAKGTVKVRGEMLDFNTLQGDTTLTVTAPKVMSGQAGVKLLPGGALEATVENSTIEGFSGPTNVQYEDWMKGTVTAKQGSAFFDGVTGKFTGSLLGTPGPQKSTAVKMAKGGTAIVNFVSGNQPIAWEAGSELSWDYQNEKWLAGVMSITTQMPFSSITGQSSAMVMEEHLLPSSAPALSLLPSEGLNVTFANNVINSFTGSAGARLQEWAEGKLVIEGSAGPTIFNGKLHGSLVGDKAIEGTQLTLVGGGAVKIDVNQNRATNIQGDIPFKWGEGRWLGGLVHAEQSQALRDITGPISQGSVQAEKAIGSFKLTPGGDITGKMSHADIAKIGGKANFQWQEGGAWWIGGALSIAGEMPPASLGGSFEGSILAEKEIGSGLKLLPGGGLRGTVARNAVTTIAGDINFRLDDWLEGIVDVQAEVSPNQVAGNAIARAVKEHHVQNNAFIIDYKNATFNAKLQNRQITKLWGSIPWRVGEWIKGVASVSDGTTSKVFGSGPGEIVGAGKEYGAGVGKVTLHPGALTRAELSANGDATLSGPVQAEYRVKGGESNQPHVGIGGNAESVTQSGYTGTVQGGLMSVLKVMPNLQLNGGGDVTLTVGGRGAPPMSGTFNFGWGGENRDFLQGTLEVQNAPDVASLSGTIPSATINQEQHSADGNFTVLTGGNVYGRLINPQDVKLEGGTFGYRYKDFLEGQITIHGSLDMTRAITANGGATGSLTRDLELGHGMVLQQGSAGEFYFENNGLTKLWGAFGFKMGEDIEGQLLVEQGNSDAERVWGWAQAQLTQARPIGSGNIVLTEGSGFELEVIANQWGDVKGSIGYTYDDEIKGHVNVSAGTLENLSGEATGTMVKQHPVSGTQLVIEAGGGLKATMDNNTVSNIYGRVNWSYGDAGWLKGSIEANTGGLDNIAGTVKGSVAIEKFLAGAPIRIKQGGGFTAQFDGTAMSGFDGTIGIVYDGWLDGTAQISGGSLEAINGEVTASTKVRKEMGQAAFLKPGATLIATFADSQLQGFAGSAAWQYEQWLEGTLEIDGGSTLESISGTGTATLRERKRIGEKVELERGGSFQAGFAGSQFKGIGGKVGFIYDTWLGGSIEVPAYSKLDTLDGQAGVAVRHNKIVAGELELQQGGSAKATMAGGSITSVQGDLNWRYGSWIGGNVHLNPSPLDALTGSADATILQHKAVGSGGFELRPGGAILVEFDATRDIAGQSFTGDVAWGYQNWLEGSVSVGAGATFDGIQGQATARLADDKQVSGDLLLKAGGNLRVELASSAPTTFGGDLLLHYQDWLAGSITIDDGSSLESISGTATAMLRKDKPIGGGDFKLLQGGNARVDFKSGAADGVSGHLNFGYQDWLTGGLEVEQGSTFDSMSGEGSAQITVDKPIGGSGFKVRSGTNASVLFENNDFYGLVGELRWGYQDWVQGTINVEKTKLEDISGDARAILVQDKPLGGKFKLLTGGDARVKVSSGDITEWGGQVRVNYDNWLQGSLDIKSPGPIESIQGDVKGTLLTDKELGKLKILQGAYLEAKFNGADIGSFGGKGRFEYDQFLIGALTIDPSSTPSSISGDVRAQLTKEVAPGGGAFKLRQGGALKATFKDSGFSNLSGRANWRYEGDKAKVSGSITLEPSTLESISGQAKAHLTGDLDAGNGLKILRGGELALSVQDSKPGTFGGRLNWQYGDWIKGNVQVGSGTGFDGPYSGGASARLIKAKQVGEAKFLRGGHLKLQFDSAAGIENTTFDGRIGVDYQSWLRGYIELEQARLTSLTGKARMQLKAGKDVGSTGMKLLKGSTANVHFASNTLTGVDGMLRYRFDDWLQGTIHVLEGSTFDSVSGEAHGQVRKQRDFDKFSLKQGSGVTVDVQAGKLGKFSGVALFGYDGWVSGSLSLDERTTADAFYGHGGASIDADKEVGGGVTLKQGSSALAVVENNKLTRIGGTLLIGYEDWAGGALTLTADQEPKSLSGLGQLVTTQPKTFGKATIEAGSGLHANIRNSKIENFDGNVAITYDDTVKGSLALDPGSTFKSLSGSASVSLVRDIDLVGDLKLKEGGNIRARFDQEGLRDISGTVELEYDSWLLGTGRMAAGSSLDTFIGDATVRVIQRKEFKGGVALEEGSYLAVSFDATGPTSYKGNLDVTFDQWLQGTLNFEAADLDSITGFGSLRVTEKKNLLGPVSILEGSYIKVNVENSGLKDFEGLARLGVEGWGEGELSVDPGSTTESVSGYGQISLTEPKHFGSVATLTSGTIGATVKASELKGIYGEVQAELNDFGKGWLRIYKSSTLEEFDGQAGLKLTEPKPIGSFAELSGGQIVANFKKNTLDSFGGWAEIDIFGWGKGKVMVDSGSTMDHIKGSAALSLEGPKEFAGGKLVIEHGSVNATVDGQQITEIGGKVGILLTDVARGEVYGTLDVQNEKFTGGGKVQQVKDWVVGPATIRDGHLDASVVNNELKSASGGATIDAGRFGQGTVEVNYIRSGDQDIIYGKAELQFQPHDRVKGILKAQITKDKQLIGEGRVIVTISQEHNITGEAAVVLREDQHVVLQGKVNIPGPYQLFKPDPYKKDITLIDKGFMVYTPPIVKVNVGAGIGLEAGITPLEISNIVVSGEVDLMEPEYAGMAVTGHLASSAYVDLSAYVEGSVSVSAAVVAVEAGLRAALNLHLEARIDADPTITVNRNGLSFDMPVSAELLAALQLILTFFAKVRVGLDVGLFSIMKTVWRYGYSPDPLELASMSIGARGHVHAGADGFDASMEPEYEPPDMTIEGLKRSLGL